MKSLRESLLDGDLVDKMDKSIKDEIEVFLKENFKGARLCKISRTPNSYGKYEVSSTKDIEVKNYNITSLTNGMFIWTYVGGYFNCPMCNYLKSLEGAPKKVDYNFNCSHCIVLESLDGAPEKIGGDFNCSGCPGLTSLEGAPKEVVWDFNCSMCESLKSLKGAPKEVGGDFICWCRRVKFNKDDVKKVSNVKGKIRC